MIQKPSGSLPFTVISVIFFTLTELLVDILEKKKNMSFYNEFLHYFVAIFN